MNDVEHVAVKPIVVGVDGSRHSIDALRWAAHQAELTGEPLNAVTSWSYPQTFGALAYWPENVDFEADARQLLKHAITEALGDAPGVTVVPTVVSGPAALALEDLSRSASLVVVGSRGHGEFAGMLLGSVSEFLSTHAHCPVVVLRGTEDE
jgi:nucleotide-binding universal stress UspA family protein